jgi:hypothetical protein
MGVLVPPPAEGPVNSPDAIGEPESDEKPSGDFAPEGFDGFNTKDSRPESNTGKPQYDRTAYMAEPA